ncbi:hypothetical protein Vretimale_11699 [Volvox reticuliferus]|uniref:EGF-like domain-containing protein n=1 Tax=Volvox reticuliferus TaxID=1737510 RepID=A0A8J4GHX0_9CHLO|nr:hypothetical protein Vretifemale_14662 [Volvox reticuliferus]GIM07616.1 hypothetical protein Vretimale_11699 [Volvox reticuliferus]
MLAITPSRTITVKLLQSIDQDVTKRSIAKLFIITSLSMHCVNKRWLLPLLGAALILCSVAFTQQSPITLTIEYQLAHNLTAGQHGLLKSVVSAAYRTLQKYVLTKTPAAPLLCERVCRTYHSPAPPPQQSQPPLPPPAAPAPAASWDGGRTVVKCYPDFSASSIDVRLQTCGLAMINRTHVQDPATLAAGADAAGGVSLDGGRGEVTDLYLYVTASPVPAYCTESGSDKGMQFYTCMYDSTTGRPTMSSLNVCPQALNLYDVDALVSRALRELIRALGVERVGFFGLAPSETYMSYIVLDVDPAELPTRFLATPRVKQAVRDFFGCDSAPGALLEDSFVTNAALYDSSVVMDEGEVLEDPDYLSRAAVAFAGWETTHFQGDILIADPDPIPAAGTSPQVTPLTLALLGDTTWYDVVGPSEAGYWSWGRGRGCALATRHCFTLLNNITASEGGVPDGGGSLTAYTGMDPDEVLFCEPASYGTSTRSCTPGGFSVGTCRTRPITTGSACGLITSISPGVGTCTARELEVAELSAGDTAAAATYGWTSGAASRCLPLAWPWIARPLPDSAAAAVVGATAFPDPTPSPPVGASCFQTSCSSTGELWVHVLGTAVPCPVGAVLNLTASGAGAVAGGRLMQALLGPCPDATAICGVYGSGGGSSGVLDPSGCNPATTCSPRGGECRPVNSGIAMRCFCRPGYGGTACQQFLGTTYDDGGGVAGPAVENLAKVASTFAVLETSIRVQIALPDFLMRQSDFLGAIDRVMNLDASISSQKLAVARVYGMSYLPSLEVGTSSLQGVRQEQTQVVVRFFAANVQERNLFLAAIENEADRVTAALDEAQFPVGGSGISYLGEAAVRIPGPPSPPPSQSSLPSRSSPLPSPPSSSPSDKSNGLTGNEKAALGVGITFGVILLVLLGVLIYQIIPSANAKQADARDPQSVELMGRFNNALFSTPILGQPPHARAGSATTGSTTGSPKGAVATNTSAAVDQLPAKNPAAVIVTVGVPATSSSVPADFHCPLKVLPGGGSGGNGSPEIEPQLSSEGVRGSTIHKTVAMEKSNLAEGREGAGGDNVGEQAPAARPTPAIAAPLAICSTGGDSAKAADGGTAVGASSDIGGGIAPATASPAAAAATPSPFAMAGTIEAPRK